MRKRTWTAGIAVLMLLLMCCTPALALEESEVESAIAASSNEAVAGNIFIWFLCAVAFLKISQKIDSFWLHLESMSAEPVEVCWVNCSSPAELLAQQSADSVELWATFSIEIMPLVQAPRTKLQGRLSPVPAVVCLQLRNVRQAMPQQAAQPEQPEALEV